MSKDGKYIHVIHKLNLDKIDNSYLVLTSKPRNLNFSRIIKICLIQTKFKIQKKLITFGLILKGNNSVL